MAKTEQARRHAREKVLHRRLKEQNRNAKKVAKRIAKIEKELWEITLDKLKDKDLFSKIPFTVSYHQHHQRNIRHQSI